MVGPDTSGVNVRIPPPAKRPGAATRLRGKGSRMDDGQEG